MRDWTGPLVTALIGACVAFIFAAILFTALSLVAASEPQAENRLRVLYGEPGRKARYSLFELDGVVCLERYNTYDFSATLHCDWSKYRGGE